jgi:hypothetical protein
MTIVTFEEIAQFRSDLSDYPEANYALQIIEECKGDLEEAFEVIIIEDGEEIKGLEFKVSLEKLAQKCRNVICKEEFKEEIVDGFCRELLTGLVPVVTAQLTLMGNFPVALSIPIVIFVIKIGIKNFCKSSELES